MRKSAARDWEGVPGVDTSLDTPEQKALRMSRAAAVEKATRPVVNAVSSAARTAADSARSIGNFVKDVPRSVGSNLTDLGHSALGIGNGAFNLVTGHGWEPRQGPFGYPDPTRMQRTSDFMLGAPVLGTKRFADGIANGLYRMGESFTAPFTGEYYAPDIERAQNDFNDRLRDRLYFDGGRPGLRDAEDINAKGLELGSQIALAATGYPVSAAGIGFVQGYASPSLYGTTHDEYGFPTFEDSGETGTQAGITGGRYMFDIANAIQHPFSGRSLDPYGAVGLGNTGNFLGRLAGEFYAENEQKSRNREIDQRRSVDRKEIETAARSNADIVEGSRKRLERLKEQINDAVVQGQYDYARMLESEYDRVQAEYNRARIYDADIRDEGKEFVQIQDAANEEYLRELKDTRDSQRSTEAFLGVSKLLEYVSKLLRRRLGG